jgi:hypothetical protein
MSSDLSRKRAPVLKPTDRASETIFGVLMAVSFTGTLSVATAGAQDVRMMAIAALGSSIAWGLTDAVMYLIDTETARNRLVELVRHVRTTPDAAKADALIAAAIPERVADAAGPRVFEAIRVHLLKLPEPQAEFDDIKALVGPKSRKMLQARSRVRALAVIESSVNGERTQPGEGDLNRLLKKVRAGKSWRDLFPGIASLELSANTEEGIPVAIRITKKEGEAVHLVPEGTPGAMIVSVKRVNELDFYSLGLKDLADKIKISQPRTLALVKHLNLQGSSEFFKVVQIGGVTFKRYSMKALDELQKAFKTVDMDKIWSLNKPTGKPSAPSSATSS